MPTELRVEELTDSELGEVMAFMSHNRIRDSEKGFRYWLDLRVLTRNP